MLMSILMAFLGAQAGRVLIYFRSHQDRVLHWLAWAIVLGARSFELRGGFDADDEPLCAAVLAVSLAGRKNESVLPINPSLFSPTFVFAAGSIGECIQLTT